MIIASGCSNPSVELPEQTREQSGQTGKQEAAYVPNMDKFLQLMREDYWKHITTFVNFDPSIKVNHDKPGKNIILPKDKGIHFSILLDASGSMYGKINGKTKMASAKEAIQEFAAKNAQKCNCFTAGLRT